jgi:hypothetical protein
VRRHETDVTSLVVGVVLAGVAGLWALFHADVVSWPDLGYLAPVLLIGAGVVGLVVSLVGGRRRDRAAADDGSTGGGSMAGEEPDALKRVDAPVPDEPGPESEPTQSR